MAHSVVHFEVVGKDFEQLESFYSRLFDWKLERLPADPPYAMVDREAVGISGGIGRSANGDGHLTFYVSTDDPQATLDRVEELGGKTVMPVTELPQVTIALFEDPAGHLVGLAKES
jgi:predicted enzyme related to lactoylglutathione lyase